MTTIVPPPLPPPPPPAMTATTGPDTDAPFPFPRDYHFPPFFSRQDNAATRHAQLTKWSALVQAYARHRRLFRLSVSGDAATEELFHNRRLGKRLSTADVRDLLAFMRRDGRAEPCAPSSSSSSRADTAAAAAAADADVWWIWWRTPDEWAADLEDWVEETGQKGAVLTVYELTSGDNTVGAVFHGMDSGLMNKVLNLIVKRGKAQMFGEEESRGVKFF